MAATARFFLNHKFKSLGKMTTLRLDTTSRTLELCAQLAGESSPIEAKIGYRLEENNGQTSLVPTHVECSRPWLEMLAAQLIADGAVRFPIPPGIAATAVKMLRV